MADKGLQTAGTGCIRVLHFVSTLSQGSGVMSVIMNYYRHIDREKVQFDFLHFIPDNGNGSSAASHAEEIKGLGGRIYLVDKPGCSIGSVKQLAAFFRVHAEEYTWLHNHEVYLTFLLRPISKRYGLEKFIVHCHATKYSDKPLNAVRNGILCLPIRFMRIERFACSEAAGKFLYGEQMMKAGKVFIMHNAIDCEKFRFRPEVRERLRKEMGLEGKFVIGHVGRFERQKNHEFLLKVFRSFLKFNPDSLLLLIGSGSLEESIHRSNSDIEEHVVFLGQRDDVNEWYQALDMLWLPSFYEGFPVVALEAQASGLHCVLSETISCEANVTGRVLYLSLNKSPESWVEKIAKFRNDQLVTRLDDWKLLKKAGYAIEYENKNVQSFYLGKGVI